MAETAYLPGVTIRDEAGSDSARSSNLANKEHARHSVLVRVTHWLNAISFLALVVSGFAIILAHPRFYWGETGGVGTPSLFDLPLPFMLGGPSGWGRYMHFEAAWLCVLSGLLYVISGVFSQHFRRNLFPVKGQLAWRLLANEVRSRLRFRRLPAEDAHSYNVLQRISYVAVVFLLLPLMIWTGMAMSPAITASFPFFVTSLGGQETARTLHFFAGIVLVLFFLVHIVMVALAGFWARTRAMITGQTMAPAGAGTAEKELR
jgi:thiosulfate reductase cytochrome b subunit